MNRRLSTVLAGFVTGVFFGAPLTHAVDAQMNTPANTNAQRLPAQTQIQNLQPDQLVVLQSRLEAVEKRVKALETKQIATDGTLAKQADTFAKHTHCIRGYNFAVTSLSGYGVPGYTVPVAIFEDRAAPRLKVSTPDCGSASS